MSFVRHSLQIERRGSLLNPRDQLVADTKVLWGVLSLSASQPWHNEELVYCGFDGQSLLETGQHGARRAFYGLKAGEWTVQLMERENPSNQPVSYALRPANKRPVIVAYSGEKLIPALTHPDLIRAIDNDDWQTVNCFSQSMGDEYWYAPQPGLSLDDVIVAAIELEISDQLTGL